MISRSQSRSIALFAVAVVFFSSLPAHASLGGDPSSVQTDAQQLKSSVRVTQSANYTVHEMQVQGATVREYIAGGKVFGITWEGQARPDLQQLLGPYYARVTQAVEQYKAQHPGRHPISIQQPDLVVQMGGHQRAFSGRAYIPNMVPSSVRAEEIR